MHSIPGVGAQRPALNILHCIVVTAVVCALAACSVGSPSTTSGPSLNLSGWNSANWTRSDGYTNGGDFNVGWRADHAVKHGSQLMITLDKTPCPNGCSGAPYASGELQSTAVYGYGTYTVQMQAAKGSGVVSTFFTYINTTPGGKETNDEIDVEIPGARTTTLEATYYKLGGPGVEHTIPLPFDAAAAMHTYAIQWAPNHIAWMIDGHTLYTATGSPSSMPTTPSHLILNFWTGSANVTDWLGPFTYTGPQHVIYGAASFTPASR